MAVVPVPDGAFIDSQVVTDESGATPAADALPGETWAIVYKGRPDATHYFSFTGFNDPWGIKLVVTGTSTTQPTEHPIWHWTVTYEPKDVTSCPTGGTGPQPTEVRNASAAPAPFDPVSRLKLTRGSNGQLLVGFNWTDSSKAKVKLKLRILPPLGHSIHSIHGRHGLTCTNNHGSSTCTSPPPKTNGMEIESVIVDLLPRITGPVHATAKTTNGTTTIELTTPH
jgi:hypothetical protein